MKAAALSPGVFPRLQRAIRAACGSKTSWLCGIAGLLAATEALPAADPPVKIWVADAMTRVSRAEAAKPDLSVLLTAARGEWEAFQVVVTGPADKVKGAKLAASALKGPDTAMIPPATVLREHYVRVARSTPGASLPAGDYPDALVPQDFPWQDLGEGTVNQPFWIDLFVPFATPPGTYSGAVTLGDSTLTIPVTVEVLPFDMPVVPELRTAFSAGWQRIAEVHGLNAKREPLTAELMDLLNQYYEMLADHRLSADLTYATRPDLSRGQLNEARIEAGMRKHLLHRHASTVGLSISRNWPLADPLGKDRIAAQRLVAQWMKLLAKIRGESRGYVTVPEIAEPNSPDGYAEVRRWGEFFNEIEHRERILIPFLVREQPTPDDGWWGRLDGTVDIWVPDFAGVWQDLESPDAIRDIARRLQAGDEVWTRPSRPEFPPKTKADGADSKSAQAARAKAPVWALDYAPVNHRVVGWLLPLHGITGLACWETLFASPGVDVWSEAGNFKVGVNTVFNGDGHFIYPATLKRHGVHAPVASIRLKWLREMAEDYDYLMLARELGVEKEARKLTETFARGFGDWDPSVDKLLSARMKLGELIAQKTKAIPVIATPPKVLAAKAAKEKKEVRKATPAEPVDGKPDPAKSEPAAAGAPKAPAAKSSTVKAATPVKANSVPAKPAAAEDKSMPAKTPASKPEGAKTSPAKATAVTAAPLSVAFPKAIPTE